MIHHITSPGADATACRRRLANRLDPMPMEDSFTVDWGKVTCPACRAAGFEDPGVGNDHDRAKSPAAWTHDCETCVYLDTVDGERVHDLYFHPDGRRPTVIARYGNSGWEYHSGMPLASRDPLLALALVLALKRGLIKFEDALRRL